MLFGIYSQYGIHCLIKNNVLTAKAKPNRKAVMASIAGKSDSMQIIGNTVSGHRDGIYFEFVTNSVIWRNNSFKISGTDCISCFPTTMPISPIFLRTTGQGLVMFSKGSKDVQ